MVARIIFPAGHPAIPFLLLLAIADDALGLMILAVFYPSGALSFTALVGSWPRPCWPRCGSGDVQIRSFWPYVLGPGVALVGRAVSRAAFIRRWRWFRSCRSCPMAPAISGSSTRASIVDRIR